ncbi:MAG: DUF2225 domain-containing protein [Deltaproteobacteria bacterium]|nr:DUF2225 domain-containing protein [Deltaproteobacteria bacterium]
MTADRLSSDLVMRVRILIVVFAVVSAAIFAFAALASAEDVSLTCPVDGTAVTGHVVNEFHSSGVDTDFAYLGASADYYQRIIATCGTCGYSGYVEDFAPATATLPDAVKKDILRKFASRFPVSAMKPWDRYEAMALAYTWRGKPADEIANAYLRATYTMRNVKKGDALKKRERELRGEAIEHLRIAIREAKISLAQLPQATYLIGELHRRNEEYDRAVASFQDAERLIHRPEWLDKLIEKQSEKAREKRSD